MALTPERYALVGEIFSEARALAPEGRSDFVQERCAGDEELLAEVLSLLENLDDWVANESEAPAAVPTVVGNYKILSVLGEGGMGVVYLAEQKKPLQRRVAIKLIHPGMHSRGVLKRFEAERQALALMQHPMIATVYDSGHTSDGRPYFVMEYVSGRPITEYCDAHRLDLTARLRAFRDLCSAVQHAHQKGIIHRDLKPSNILMASAEGETIAKVIDFGIAKSLQGQLVEGSLHTQVEQAIGTPEYMSPEQARGSADIDTRSDVYSLGVVLYELICGDLPFRMESHDLSGFEDLRGKILESEPPRPSTQISEVRENIAQRRGVDVSTLRRQVRGDLDWIVLKALEKDPVRRYSSVDALSDDLGKHLLRLPVSARPPSVVYRSQRFLSRNRRGLFAVAACVVVAIVTGSLGWSWFAKRSLEAKKESSRQYLSRGLETLKRWENSRSTRRELHARWVELRGDRPPWAGEWARSQEIAVWHQRREVAGDSAQRTFWYFSRAVQEAPKDSEERRAARTALYELFSSMQLEVDALSLLDRRRIFESMMFGLETAEPDLGRSEFEVTVKTRPPGAEVFCFRYVEDGALLRLEPYQLASDVAKTEDDLIVEKVWSPELCPLASGDVIESVDGAQVSRLSEFVAAIHGASSSVTVRVSRGEERVSVDWDLPPELSLRAHEDLRRFLGVSFRAFPLQVSEDVKVGVTSTEGLRLQLEVGSYLLLFRRPGYRDVRFPIATSSSPESVEVNLYRDEEIPEGFLLVSGGRFVTGGDPDSDQSLDPAWRDVDDFFMAKYEVTVGEYLKFVNDPEVLKLTDSEGFISPLSPEVQSSGEDGVLIVPRSDKRKDRRFFGRSDDGTWELAPPLQPDWPVFGVSRFAVLEYLHWHNAHNAVKVRLPSDVEWERAARGADERVFVWGDYPLWGFCHMAKSIVEDGRKRYPVPVGAYPTDESVFGIRDMAGSVAEMTADIVDTESGMHSVRGGSWFELTGSFARISNRNGRLPRGSSTASGFRLVVDIPSGGR
ncbi:MAG: SUMF1/EgtB/PvdO family nonheme iron enzyme [Planctomycetota bacterium]